MGAFEVRRKRPRDGSGAATNMIIGYRLRDHENGEDVADGDFEDLSEISEAMEAQAAAGGAKTPTPTEESLCPF